MGFDDSVMDYLRKLHSRSPINDYRWCALGVDNSSGLCVSIYGHGSAIGKRQLYVDCHSGVPKALADNRAFREAMGLVFADVSYTWAQPDRNVAIWTSGSPLVDSWIAWRGLFLDQALEQDQLRFIGKILLEKTVKQLLAG